MLSLFLGHPVYSLPAVYVVCPGVTKVSADDLSELQKVIISIWYNRRGALAKEKTADAIH